MSIGITRDTLNPASDSCGVQEFSNFTNLVTEALHKGQPFILGHTGEACSFCGSHGRDNAGNVVSEIRPSD